MTTEHDPPRFPARPASLSDAARYRGVSLSTIIRRANAGDLTRFRAGGLVVVDLDEVDRLTLHRPPMTGPNA